MTNPRLDCSIEWKFAVQLIAHVVAVCKGTCTVNTWKGRKKNDWELRNDILDMSIIMNYWWNMWILCVKRIVEEIEGCVWEKEGEKRGYIYIWWWMRKILMGKTTCGTEKRWVSVLKKGVVESGEFFFWMWKGMCGLKKGECLGRTESVWEKKGKGSESVCKKGRRELKGELNGWGRFLMGKTTWGTKKKLVSGVERKIFLMLKATQEL